MNITLARPKQKLDLLILPVFKESEIKQALKQNKIDLPSESFSADFKKELGDTLVVYSQNDPKRILLVGLGEKKSFEAQSWRIAIESSVNLIKSLKLSAVGLALPQKLFGTLKDFIELTGFAVAYSSYEFEEYKKEKKVNLPKEFIILQNEQSTLKKTLEQGVIIGTAANASKDLSNHPANVATPTHLADHALKAAKQFNFTCKVLGSKEIQNEGMGLLTAVSAGSEEPAKFIILEYGNTKKPPVVLVGKGLTFDSGGISIKPSEKMEEMKYDMSGGAVVLGVFEAVAKLKLPIHLVGLIPSSENLVSGKAVKPGDIIKSHSGETVEIINTDAEGRLVLADALSFANKHYKPRMILDFATLTGAVSVALGDQYTGYFSNTKAFVKDFQKASEKMSEKFWELPLAEEYQTQMKSSVADIKNVGEHHNGGVITAALFLKHFVGTTPWIHFDTGGTSWTTSNKSFAKAGSTGWGVYLTVEFLRQLK